MEVGMDYVRMEFERKGKRFEKQQRVEIQLVPGRAGFEFVVPGNAGDAYDGYSRDVPTDVIGDDTDIMAERNEGARLFVYSDVAPPVREVWGRRYHKNSQPGFSQGLFCP